MHLGLHCRVVVSIDHLESVIWLTPLVQIARLPEPAIFRSTVNVVNITTRPERRESLRAFCANNLIDNGISIFFNQTLRSTVAEVSLCRKIHSEINL